MRSSESHPFFIIFYFVLTNSILVKSEEEVTTISSAADDQLNPINQGKENTTLKPVKTSIEENGRYSKYLAERERILEKLNNLDASIGNQNGEREEVDEGTGGKGMATLNGAAASNEPSESVHRQASSSADYSMPYHLTSPSFYYIQPPGEYSNAPYQQQYYYSPYYNNYGGNGYGYGGGGGYYYPSSSNYYPGGGYGGGMPWGGYGGVGNLFNLGLGWGFNLGLPSLGTGVGVGSGLGVNVG